MESGDVEEKTADRILHILKYRKEWAVKRGSEIPFWDNPEAKYLPIMPVISGEVINIPTLMKMIVNDDKPGRTFVEPEKIKNEYEGKNYTEFCYWALDVRINELRYDCPSLTVAETIAYILHNPSVLSEYSLDSGGSRYKRARKKPQLYLRTVDGYPILYWASRDYFVPKTIAMPTCSLRLIH